MTPLNPEQAYIAVDRFLETVWRSSGQPTELGLFWDMCSYMPGVGSGDPAMWWDWLGAVKQVQTGVVTPEGEWRSLKPEDMAPLGPEQAFLAMIQFIEDYWNRVSRPAEIGDLLGRMRYTPGIGTADPSIWQTWLAEFEKAQDISTS